MTSYFKRVGLGLRLVLVLVLVLGLGLGLGFWSWFWLGLGWEMGDGKHVIWNTMIQFLPISYTFTKFSL